MDQKGMKELIGEIEALVGATRREREALRRASVTTAVVSGALLVIVAVFMFVNYQQFKTEWTEEKLSAGFAQELEILNPVVTEQVQQLSQHLLPIYAEAGRQQFMAMRPEIAERVNAEINNLGAGLRTDSENRLTTSTDRINQQTNEIVFGSYPSLQNESEQAKLTQSLHAATDAAVTEATAEFAGLFAKDVHALEQRIHGFHTTKTDEPTLELEKRFIHLWLQLLDTEIMKR